MDDMSSSRDARAEAARIALELHEARESKVLKCAAPRPDYDPKALAREVYDRTIDSRVYRFDFEFLWTKIRQDLEAQTKRVRLGRALVALTREEFIDSVTASVEGANALSYLAEVEYRKQRAEMYLNRAMLSVQERVADKQFWVDLESGVVRVDLGNGQPVEDKALVRMGGDVPEDVKELLDMIRAMKVPKSND